MGRLQRLKEVYIWLPAQTKVYVNIFAVFLLFASFMAVDAAYNSDMAKEALRPKLYWTEQKAKIDRLIAEDDETHNMRAAAFADSIAAAYARFEKARTEGLRLYPHSPDLANAHAFDDAFAVEVLTGAIKTMMREDAEKHSELLRRRTAVIRNLEEN